MKETPAAMFVVDLPKEHIAVAEAKRLGMTVIGIADTNSNPEEIQFPIPGNDDAIRSIHLFCNEMAAAMNEGKAALADETGVELEPVTVEETEALIAEAVAEGEEFAFETEEA
jgi:small subunit ribosomal protein S2